MSTFHAARVDGSPQLQSLLGALRRHGIHGATSIELQDECRIVAVGTRISELRHNGYDVQCKYERKTDAGAKIYRYTLVDVAPSAEVVVRETDESSRANE